MNQHYNEEPDSVLGDELRNNNTKKRLCLKQRHCEKTLEKLPKINIFLHISSSYAKILGETNFQAREIPRSG